MPMPNRAAPAGFRYSNGNLSLPDYFDKDKFYNLVLKFDWNFGDKHRAFFRHLSNDRTEDRSSNGIDNKPGTDGQQPFQRINDAYVVDWVALDLDPERASYNRFIEKGYGRANEGSICPALGCLSPAGATAQPGLLRAVEHRQRLRVDGPQPEQQLTNTFQVQFSVTKVTGAHNIKAGLTFGGSTGYGRTPRHPVVQRK
jgi:hypothetical protein